MKKYNTFIPPEPYAQIRANCIVLYSQMQYQNYQRHDLSSHQTYTSKATAHTKKRILKAIDILQQLSTPQWIFNPVNNRPYKHSLSFITLTIPAFEKHITHSQGYALVLKPFLQKMLRKHKMNTYVWKAEYQKNGQLHYHLTTPSFIHYQEIRNDWNACLNTAGLLNHRKHFHRDQNPNSTDIHAVYKIKNVSAYMAKYLTKSAKPPTIGPRTYPTIEIPKDKTITQTYIVQTPSRAPALYQKGKIWDCSQNIKGAKFFSFPMPNIFNEFYNVPETTILDNCAIVKCHDPKDFLPGALRAQYDQYITHLKAS